jgi:glycosyltransferase involved in cell wall biosynthesis
MKLSIGVACLNEKDKIGEFLDSISKQTVKPELVIIDGGSTDGTLDIIGAFQKENKNIHVYKETGKYKSPSNARNLSLKNATGQAFTFMDVDETISPNYAEAIVKAFKKNPKADRIEIKLGMIEPPRFWEMLRTVSFYRDNRKKIRSILKGKSPMTGNVYRRSYLMKKYPVFDPKLGFGEDRIVGEKLSVKPVFSKEKAWRFRTSSFLNLSQFTRRYKWYGRTIPPYIARTKDIKMLLSYTLAVISPFTIVLLLIPFLRGLYFSIQWFFIHKNWKVFSDPFLEVLAWIYISIGFFQYLIGIGSNRGRF